MDKVPSGLTGASFWLAIAFIVLAIVWLFVKKQQMKHELTLKLLEKGKDIDQELLAKLLAADKPGPSVQQKSMADQNREGGGVVGLIFLVAGLMFAFVGMMRDPVSWLVIGLGAFSFAFGYLCWVNTHKEYQQAKADEKMSRD